VGVLLEVSTVIVEVPGVVPVIDTDEVEKLHVGSVELVAPAAGVVTAQVSVTEPVKLLAGVTVTVTLPLEFWGTVMEPLFKSEKLVLPPGASQKSPQPERNAATANSPAQRPIFIAAP
jgi:hypothetical protein